MKINVYKTLSLIAVCCLVLVVYLPSAHALASVNFAIKEICSHMQGNLGGLLMAAAGVGGIASAAFGNMKAMYSCLITAIGAFGVSSILSLHFQEAYKQCVGTGGTGKSAAAFRTFEEKRSVDSEVSSFNPESAAKSYIAYSKNKEAVASENDVAKSESDVTGDVKAEDEDSDLDLF